MKSTHPLFLFAAVLAMSGCGKKETPPPAPAVVTPALAPAPGGNGYLGTMLKAQQSAIKTVDVTSLNSAIQQFNVQEGRNPKDLNELVTTHYIALIPDPPVGMKLVYDPVEGKVTTAPK